jgi:hypothetical protein
MAASGALFNFEQVSASTYHVYLLQLATAAGISNRECTAPTIRGNRNVRWPRDPLGVTFVTARDVTGRLL